MSNELKNTKITKEVKQFILENHNRLPAKVISKIFNIERGAILDFLRENNVKSKFMVKSPVVKKKVSPARLEHENRKKAQQKLLNKPNKPKFKTELDETLWNIDRSNHKYELCK